jgi:tetratricopeptide (TPR) repeat protein
LEVRDMRGFHRQPRIHSRAGWARTARRGGKIVKEIAKRLTFARVAFIVLGLPLVFYIYREITRDVLIVDPIAVPKQLEEAGLTPQVMANRLGDKLQEIEKSTNTSVKKDVLGAGEQELAVPEIEIPGTKLGLRSVVEVGRSIFGRHPKHIGGDIVLSENVSGVTTENDPVVVTAYFVQEQIGRQSLSDKINSGDVPDLVQRLAELALRQVNPYVLAANKYDQQQFDKAISIAEEMTLDSSLDRDHRVEAFNLWGNALDEEGKYEEAIPKFASAVELDPKYAYAYNGWGNSLYEEGRHNEAIAKYAKAVKLDPKFSYAYNDWGNALSDEGKNEEAIEKYAKAIEIDPKYAKAYYNWGFVLDDEGKYEEAIAKYAKTVQLDPTHAAAYRSWGTDLRILGRQKDADEKFAIAAQLGLPR